MAFPKLNINLPAIAAIVPALRTAVEHARDELRAIADLSKDASVAADARAAADFLQGLLDSTDFPVKALEALAEAQTALEKFKGPRVHKPSDLVG